MAKELKPRARHMVISPPVVDSRWYCGQRRSRPKTIGKSRYMMPLSVVSEDIRGRVRKMLVEITIAQVPMTAMLPDPLNGSWVE